MTHIITSGDKQLSRQDKFNNWTRDAVNFVATHGQIVGNNLLAIQRILGITEERLQEELGKIDEERKTKQVGLPEEQA